MDEQQGWCAVVGSPVGEMVVCWGAQGVFWVRQYRPGVALVDQARACGREVAAADEVPEEIVSALAGSGPGAAVDLAGVEGLRREVLEATARIPRGETRSYAEIARAIGREKAVRAVGTALGHNPVPLLIPCHRVVRSDGTAGNFIFGAPAKQALLEAEGAVRH